MPENLHTQSVPRLPRADVVAAHCCRFCRDRACPVRLLLLFCCCFVVVCCKGQLFRPGRTGGSRLPMFFVLLLLLLLFLPYLKSEA